MKKFYLFKAKKLPHKPSKYHYHLKVDQIYGDKILKLCGQCTQPENLIKDLRYLDKNMKRFESLTDDSNSSTSTSATSTTSTALSSQSGGNASSLSTTTNGNHFHHPHNNSGYHPHHSSSLPIMQQQGKKLVSRADLLMMHRSSMQTLDSSGNKLSIEFDVLDLSSGRQSGVNLPIVVLPVDICRFTQLKRLHLDCNQIRVVPDELGQNLVNLEILTLSNNRLKVKRITFYYSSFILIHYIKN